MVYHHGAQLPGAAYGRSGGQAGHYCRRACGPDLRHGRSHLAGWFSFQPLYEVIVAEQPELLG